MKKILLILLIIPLLLTGCTKEKQIKELPDGFTYEYRYGKNASTSKNIVFLDPGLNREKFVKAYNERIELSNKEEKEYDLKLNKKDEDNIKLLENEVNIKIYVEGNLEYDLSFYYLNDKIYYRIYEDDKDAYYYKEISKDLSDYYLQITRIIIDINKPKEVVNTSKVTTTKKNKK